MKVLAKLLSKEFSVFVLVFTETIKVCLTPVPSGVGSKKNEKTLISKNLALLWVC
jgi:hypothetical protein